MPKKNDYVELNEKYIGWYGCESVSGCDGATHVLKSLVTSEDPFEFLLPDMEESRLICTECFNKLGD